MIILERKLTPDQLKILLLRCALTLKYSVTFLLFSPRFEVVLLRSANGSLGSFFRLFRCEPTAPLVAVGVVLIL